MRAIIEGKVLGVKSKTYEGKTSMNALIFQEGSEDLVNVKMTVEEASTLNIKEGASVRIPCRVTSYKDNSQNARLSVKYSA